MRSDHPGRKKRRLLAQIRDMARKAIRSNRRTQKQKDAQMIRKGQE